MAGTHELPMRLLTCCDTAMDQCAGAHFCRACDQLLEDPADGSDNDVVVAYQFRFAKPWGERVDCDVKLGNRMVASDVADCEDFEEFADVVAVTHAGLLGIVQSVEDICGLAFRELAVVSRCYAELFVWRSDVLTLVM